MKKTIIVGIAGLLALSSCVSKKHHAELIEKYTNSEKEVAALKETKNALSESIDKQKIAIITKEAENGELSKLVAQKDVVIESKNNQINQIKNPQIPMNLENEIDKVSYSLGVSVAENIKQQGLEEINSAAFAKAVEDIYAGKTTQINGAEANQILQSFFQKKQASQFDGNKSAGEKFLAENAKKPGVVTTPSGLQYVILTKGTGEKPTAASTVKTHYHGTLIDGTVFDSSVDRGEPISFPVGGVIAGWTEALQLMPVGSKWKLFIPYNLAYGERGAGGKIGPFSALVFEVELLGIE